MNDKPRKIGLTGGIGAGKSTVSARFRSLGAYVLDADAVSRALLEPSGDAFEAVLARFPDVTTPDGRIDRKRLAGIVFADESALAALNAIVHPRVNERMHADADAYLAANPASFVIFDVPLLIECGMHRGMDAVVLVTADMRTRIARVMRRDGCTRKEAESRIRAQLSQRKKRAYADAVLDNNGSLDLLYVQIDVLYARFSSGDDAR